MFHRLRNQLICFTLSVEKLVTSKENPGETRGEKDIIKNIILSIPIKKTQEK